MSGPALYDGTFVLSDLVQVSCLSGLGALLSAPAFGAIQSDDSRFELASLFLRRKDPHFASLAKRNKSFFDTFKVDYFFYKT